MVAKVTLPNPAALPKSESPADKAIRLAMGSLDTAESYIHGAWMAARSLDGDELPAGEALQAIISSAGDALGEVRAALRKAGAQVDGEDVIDPLRAPGRQCEMARWIDQAEVMADEIAKCAVQARAVVALCERAAWSDLQNGANGIAEQQVAEDIQFALQLANGLLGPVQDALESHEGLKGRSEAKPARMTGGQRNG